MRRDVRGVQLFDLDDRAAIDLQPNRGQRVAPLHLEPRLQRDLTGDRIGNVDLEGSRARSATATARPRRTSICPVFSVIRTSGASGGTASGRA